MLILKSFNTNDREFFFFSFCNCRGIFINIKNVNIMYIAIIYIYIHIYRGMQWHPTPVLLPGKSYRRRSLVGCSSLGREESDTTERLHFHFSLSCIGEGNGNPLQCSCLENPRDGGGWWAASMGSHRVGHD